MKKNLLLYILLLTQAIVFGQSVPNGSFESWTSASFDNPLNYPFTSSPQAYFKCQAAPNCVKVNDPYHGSFAIKLTTTISANDTCDGFFINTNANGNPSTWHGGFPYNQMATGMRGYYK